MDADTSPAAVEVPTSWGRVADLFSVAPGVAHLNHGSFGAVPIPVQQAQQRLRDEMDANPMAFFTRGLIERVDAARHLIADFLNADPAGTALVANATTAIQIVLGSVGPLAGKEIAFTDHAHQAVRGAVERAASHGAVPREVTIDPSATDDEAAAAIVTQARPGHTALAIVEQVTSPTARLLPVGPIVRALREVGVPVLIDGAHCPGMLDVDVTALGADYWLGNLHKWAFGPRPSGVLVVAAEHRDKIQPLVVSWPQLDRFPGTVEFAGTLDYTAWLAAPEGIALLRRLGVDAVRRYNTDLAAYGQRVVGAALGLTPADLPPPQIASPGVSGLADTTRTDTTRTDTTRAEVSMRVVPLPAGVADDSVAALALRGRIAAEATTEVWLDAWHGRGHLRLSAQIYNTPQEYDRLAAALPALLGRG